MLFSRHAPVHRESNHRGHGCTASPTYGSVINLEFHNFGQEGWLEHERAHARPSRFDVKQNRYLASPGTGISDCVLPHTTRGATLTEAATTTRRGDGLSWSHSSVNSDGAMSNTSARAPSRSAIRSSSCCSASIRARARAVTLLDMTATERWDRIGWPPV